MRVPDGWKDKTVGDLVKFSGGSQPPRSTFIFKPMNGYVRLIQIRDYKTDKFATFVPTNLAKKFCKKTDIMIGRYGPPIFQILRGIEGAYNVALIKAIPTKYVINDYLFYYLKQDVLFRFIECLSQRSSGQTGIEMDALNAYPFPLPPQPEQQIIAQTLSTWDKAIEKLEALIVAKQKRKKALMQQLLAGKKRFAGFEGEWKELLFSEFLDIHVQAVPKPSEPYTALGIRSHGKGTFQRFVENPDTVEMDTLYKVVPRDLIINITFAWEGAAAIVKEGDVHCHVSHRFPTYRFNELICLSDYFKQVILTKYFVFNLGVISPGGAGRNRVLSKKDFLKQTIKLPTITEQQKIASTLSAADKEIEIHQNQLSAMKEQKKGLMQQLLTGKKRVKIKEPEQMAAVGA